MDAATAHLAAHQVQHSGIVDVPMAAHNIKTAMHTPPEAFDFSDNDSVLGTSPVSPLPAIKAALPTVASGIALHEHAAPQVHAQQQPAAPADALSFTNVSLRTLVGCSEMLGHTVEDRTSVAVQQQAELVQSLQAVSTTPLRSASQKPLFIVAPLDVLVTRDDNTGRNTFHIIEINGTGIAGLSNMPDAVVGTIMRSISEVPAQLAHIQDLVILVASSGQESFPPVSRTIHEKVLYIEALKRGFEAMGSTLQVTNMTRLEKEPSAMPKSGPVAVLGYMKQFRKHFELTGDGKLTLVGRQVHAAINDRFVLNIMHQFNHKVDLTQFTGLNVGFTAGADKGVAYTLYNQYFGPQGCHAAEQHTNMAPMINFARAHTREQLVQQVQVWLQTTHRPVVIKPQGTGCGHGIEFFFGAEPREEVEGKVDASITTVQRNYNLECGGLPHTVCEFLNTAAISDAAAKRHDGHDCAVPSQPHPMAGHKFELRIVVYRDGDVLKAYPSIAKVARDAFDPDHPDKSSLINNITTSAKETGQGGSEFMLPLASRRTLDLLDIQQEELADLCAASTAFVRYTIDQVQDAPELFGLPPQYQRGL